MTDPGAEQGGQSHGADAAGWQPGGEPRGGRGSGARRGDGLQARGPVKVAAIAIMAVLALLLGVAIAIILRPDDTVAVPSVEGLSTADATEALGQLGLEVEVVEVPVEDARVGTVVGQEPDEATRVAKGSVVRLNVGVGTPPSAALVTVPGLGGMTRGEATDLLDSLGLVWDTSPVPREDVPPGEVVDQDPAPGTSVPEGSLVTLGIARKPATPDNVVAWLARLGPGAPEGPTDMEAYKLLLDPQTCPELARALRDDDLGNFDSNEQRRVYEGAADACLAAFHGRTSRWARAEAALSSLDRPTSCLDASVFRLLRQLVNQHIANQDGVFRVSETDSTRRPCPTITRLSPRHDELGSRVRVIGDNLDRYYDVRVQFLHDGRLRNGGDTDEALDGDAIEVTIEDEPDAEPTQWACVIVLPSRQWYAVGEWFAIDPPEGSGLPKPDPRSPPDVACPPASP